MHHKIEVESLSFSYPDGRRALHNISFLIKPGEKVALVGPNGAGKSTLILHLNGILKGQGKICIAGLEVTDANLGQIRGAVGLVFQNPDDQLFSLTVFDDVAFGPLHMGLPDDVVRTKVNGALAAVGMSDYVERVSHHLSIGEKKRIAIATVLAMDPQILVLDEPTAGLDPRARRRLIHLLHQMDMTMLVSTHDMRMVAELFDRTIIMEEGCIVAHGPTLDILADQALLDRHGLEMV